MSSHVSLSRQNVDMQRKQMTVLSPAPYPLPKYARAVYIHLSVCLFFGLSVCPSVCLSVCLSGLSVSIFVRSAGWLAGWLRPAVCSVSLSFLCPFHSVMHCLFTLVMNWLISPWPQVCSYHQQDSLRRFVDACRGDLLPTLPLSFGRGDLLPTLPTLIRACVAGSDKMSFVGTTAVHGHSTPGVSNCMRVDFPQP